MSHSPLSTLTTNDWNEEWKQVQTLRRKNDDAQYWNKRSKNFSDKDSPSHYVQRFLELMDIKPDETVFDMGCGTGSIAVPLALAGHKVVAADFSQGMLDQAQLRAEEAGVKTVFTKLMSWDEEWEPLGVREGMVDICVASRSIATADLGDALARLNKVARRRVCLTVTTGSSPRMDSNILKVCGIDNAHGRDYQYVFNILANRGIEPEVSYIHSTRKDTFGSLEQAQSDFGRMIDDVADENEPQAIEAAKERLRAWLKDNVVPNESAGQPDSKGNPEGALRLKNPRVITWAFISWDKASER